MKTFEEFSAMNAHQQEIASSRVGCLGSSDAAMVLKVARKGIESLSNTDIKRLRVMLGFERQEDFGGNVYTNAGHLFEDYIANSLPNAEREKRLEWNYSKPRNFRVIAHADFIQDGRVNECKFVQKPMEKVLQQYMPQLQWYYLFDEVVEVVLVHGQGDADPFFIGSIDTFSVNHDEQYMAQLMHGLQMIDDWCDEYLAGQHEQPKSVQDEDDEVLVDLLVDYNACKATIDMLTKELDAIKAAILEHMEKNNIQSGDTRIAKVTYKAANVQRRIDAAKVQEKYPQVTTDNECWKNVNIKSSITIKLKDNESENN